MNSNLQKLLQHNTHLGPVFIARCKSTGRFHVVWKENSVDHYDCEEKAVWAAAEGVLSTVMDSASAASLRISDNRLDWHRIAD